MKKLISVVALVAVLMGVFAVCAFADPKQDIIDQAKDVCPDGFEDQYLPAVENILNQIMVTDEQAAVAVAAMENSRAIVNSGKGTRLDDYTQAEKDHVLADLKKGCDALGLGYRIYENDKATSVEFYVKDAKDVNGNAIAPGTLLGSVQVNRNGLTPNTSGPVGSNFVLVAVAAAFVVLASAAFVAQKTRA